MRVALGDVGRIADNKVVRVLVAARERGVPLVYDVHHHRCHGDGLSEAEATEWAVATWGQEPLFHVSSPLAGWEGPEPERHHDFIDLADFPACWRGLDLTVEVEAKAKEVAVLKLMSELQGSPHGRVEPTNNRENLP